MQTMMDIGRHDHGHSDVYFAIPATLLFNETSCMIGINPLLADVQFSFDGERVIASGGYTLDWPDEENGRRVVDMLRRMRNRVLLVEFGPEGPIAEHPIN